MAIDIANPQELDALMVRVHSRRVAAVNAALKKPMPPGIAAALARDTVELMRADNAAYLAWCEARGVECLICGNGEYSEWLGEPLPYAEHPSIARQAAERRDPPVDFGDKLLTVPKWYTFTPPRGRFLLRR